MRTPKLFCLFLILAVCAAAAAFADPLKDKAPYSIERAEPGLDGKSAKFSLELQDLSEERTAATLFIKGKIFNPLPADLKNVIVEASFVTEGNNSLHRSGITIPVVKAGETLNWAITVSPAEKKEFLDVHQVPFYTYAGVAGVDGVHSGVEKWESIKNSIQYRPVPAAAPAVEELPPETVEYH